MHQKTIAISINRGILVRNFLRTDFLKLLLAKNVKVVILLPERQGRNLPDYFIKELQHKNLTVEVIKNKGMNLFERQFFKFILKLPFSQSTRLYMLYNIKEHKRSSKYTYYFSFAVYTLLSKIKGFKALTRKIDAFLFQEKEYERIFKKYRPDLYFATCVLGQFDAALMKMAKRMNIKVAAMPRSWDNLDKLFFRHVPDLFLVQNNTMVDPTIRYQEVDPGIIHVVGFPQFDIYTDKSVLISREEYCRRKNFDPGLPILFLGSEGVWTSNDDQVFEKIINFREKGIIPNCNFLVRPHFSMLKKHNYNRFGGLRNVFIDDKYRQMDYFVDNWDMTRADMEDFTNSLHHCDILITFNSTLTIDASIFNKPVIAITFGGKFIDGVDRTKELYTTLHFQWVVRSNAISIVDNEDQLKKEILDYLQNPDRKSAERKKLVEDLCYKIDGQASHRIIEHMEKLLGRDQ